MPLLTHTFCGWTCVCSIPDDPDWSDPWSILLGNGTIQYLEVMPSENRTNAGTYRWTSDYERGQQSALDNFVSFAVAAVVVVLRW